MNSKVENVVAQANAHYEYETEHEDAANNYSVITDEHVKQHYGIEYPFADEIYFGNWYRLPRTEVQENDSFNETEWLIQDGYVQSWKVGDKIYAIVYLGQEEVEIQVEETLTKEEMEWINRNSDFVVNNHGASDTLLYTMYPEIWVVAEYDTEE